MTLNALQQAALRVDLGNEHMEGGRGVWIAKPHNVASHRGQHRASRVRPNGIGDGLQHPETRPRLQREQATVRRDCESLLELYDALVRETCITFGVADR